MLESEKFYQPESDLTLDTESVEFIKNEIAQLHQKYRNLEKQTDEMIKEDPDNEEEISKNFTEEHEKIQMSIEEYQSVLDEEIKKLKQKYLVLEKRFDEMLKLDPENADRLTRIFIKEQNRLNKIIEDYQSELSEAEPKENN